LKKTKVLERKMLFSSSMLESIGSGSVSLGVDINQNLLILMPNASFGVTSTVTAI
jgi:hypothetical protein